MNKIKNSYGICVQNCEIINSISRKCEQLRQGDLLRILEMTTGDFCHSGIIIVKVYDGNTINTDLFECAKHFTNYVNEELWAYLIGSQEHHKRIRIYNERNLVLGLIPGHEITIKSYDNDSNAMIKAEVKLIGEVTEVGVGNFVGLKLLNKPKRNTIVTLYKKHFNQSTSLLLFRIEQLLDYLRDAEQQNTEHNPNLNYHEKPELFSCRWKLEQQTNNTEALTYPLLGDVENPIELDLFKSSEMLVNSNTSQTLFDLICDENTPSQSRVCLPLLKPIMESDSKSNLIDTSEIQIRTKIGNFCPFPIEMEKCSGAQSTQVNINQKGAIPKRDGPATVKTQNRRNFQPKKMNDKPNDIKFKATPVVRTNHLGRKLRQCDLCSRSFGDDTLVFKCNHCICVQCFGTKISRLIGMKRVQCPFTSADFSCKYQLQQFELTRLCDKFDKYVLLLKNDNRPKSMITTKRDDFKCEEELYECKTDRCTGKWFISKSDPANLFRCPLCKIKNCVDCNIIHDNMTCTEYNTQIGRAGQNGASNINNIIAGVEEQATVEPRKCPEAVIGRRAGNEMIIKCKKRDCAGKWFVAKNEETKFFNCPVCNEYQEIGQRKYLSNTRNPYFPLKTGNPNGGARSAYKGYQNREWSCTYCTFDNFNWGLKCKICGKLNNN